ncbi:MULTISPECIES: FadR/GntR family transcriptional regulator [unclassified Streptomyces]|uniref:FadR/GntR family transcriptional regulator n=1 Tax=unclassified Streptomyces TaxID=2593676 RepID=UPI0036F8D232
MLRPVPRPVGLFERVVDRLRQQITSGAWPVGSRIPTEPELVRHLGVARNTVREAVRALAHNGLLDIRHGSGTYVVATSELAGVMRRRFGGAEQGDVIEVRGALEVAAARMAARRRTEEDLRLLDVLLERGADADFHRAVVVASRNEVLVELYAHLGQLSARDRSAAPPCPDAREGHSRLLAALRASAPGAAAAEAAAHRFGRHLGG